MRKGRVWCCRTMRLQTPSYLAGLGIQHLPEIFAANLGKAEMYLQIGRFRTQPGNEGQAKNIQHVWLRDTFVGEDNQLTLSGIKSPNQSVYHLCIILQTRISAAGISGAHEFSKKWWSMFRTDGLVQIGDKSIETVMSDFRRVLDIHPLHPLKFNSKKPLKSYQNPIPNDPITLSDDDWGV